MYCSVLIDTSGSDWLLLLQFRSITNSIRKICASFEQANLMDSTWPLDWLSLSCQLFVMNSIQEKNKLTLNSSNVLWIAPMFPGKKNLNMFSTFFSTLLSLRLFLVSNTFHLIKVLITEKVWKKKSIILMMNLMLAECKELILRPADWIAFPKGYTECCRCNANYYILSCRAAARIIYFWGDPSPHN